MNPEIRVPDGGWGWAVVTGTAVINVFNQSLLSLFGLVFGSKLQSIAGTTGVTTVMSLNCTISNFSGFLISPLSKYLNEKQITQIGVFFVSFGLALSSFTKSYSQVTICYGVLTGLGLGLIASSTFLIVNSYFDKNKSQAVGLSMAGTSVGQMVMPPIVALLVEYYGYDGTILILAGLSLHGLIGAMVFDPVSKHMVSRNAKNGKTKGFFRKSRDWICCRRYEDRVVIENNLAATSSMNKNSDDLIRETNLNAKELEAESSNLLININDKNNVEKNSSNNNESISDTLQKNKEIDDERQNNNKAEKTKMLPNKLSAFESTIYEDEAQAETCWQKTVKLFDLEILLDPIFVHIMIGLSFAYTTSISFSTFFPLFLTVDLDMSIIEASTCMAALSFMDFIGRIIVPLLTKQMDTTHRTVFIIGSLLLAISRSMLVIQRTYTMVMLLSAVCGLARAATVINQNLVIAEYSKEAHVSSAVGLNMVSKGVFVLTIGRLLGVYKDSAHNYGGCIHILNIISLGVVVSWTMEIIIRRLFGKQSNFTRRNMSN